MKLTAIRFGLSIVATALLCGATGSGRPDRPTTGTIVGCVADTSGRALAYVNVIIPGSTQGAMTIANGRYAIMDVRPGTYTVKAMMMGYKPVAIGHVVVTAGDTTTVDFAMVRTIVVRTQLIATTAERPSVDPSRRPKDMPVDDLLESVSLKAGILKQGDEMHVRGGGGGHKPYPLAGESEDSPQVEEVDSRVSPAPKTSQFEAMPWPQPRVKVTESKCVGRVTTPSGPPRRCVGPMNTESYAPIKENAFRDVGDHPFSTFSIDVDAASYANARRFINAGRLPPPDAVRIEEFVNYFDYDYPDPTGDDPFAIVTELAACPWDAKHQLLHIGLQGKRLRMDELPPSNLVFLIDVSGSMTPENKLPLLIRSFQLLVDRLRDKDRVAIVVYAGSSGLVLPSTPGSERDVIRNALGRLRAGGSTAGAAGIQLAYQVAEENFIDGGNNRVILATDGDFNVGVTDNGRLTRMIEEKRKSGVFLSTLGFGMGNYKDDRLEMLADKGNGAYYYVDSIQEGRRVFVGQLAGTLFAIAKDVKIQLEFNPTKVASYRLIGFENRMLHKEDFANDKKDAGELGAGHSVTALYEVVPAGASDAAAVKARDTKYVRTEIRKAAYETDELLTVRLRYKRPDEDTSRLIERPFTGRAVVFGKASESMRFATAVAELAMLLRGSDYANGVTVDGVIATARGAMSHDPDGYRAEFVRLANVCGPLLARE